jgi:hypothetical protein
MSPTCAVSRQLTDTARRPFTSRLFASEIYLSVWYTASISNGGSCFAGTLATGSTATATSRSPSDLPIGTGVGFALSQTLVGANVLSSQRANSVAGMFAPGTIDANLIVMRLKYANALSSEATLSVATTRLSGGEQPSLTFSTGVGGVDLSSLTTITILMGCSQPFARGDVTIQRVRLSTTLGEATASLGNSVPAPTSTTASDPCNSFEECPKCTGDRQCSWCPGNAVFRDPLCVSLNRLCDDSVVTDPGRCSAVVATTSTAPVSGGTTSATREMTMTTTAGGARTTCDDITRCDTCMQAGCNWCGHSTNHGYCINVSGSQRCGASFTPTNVLSKCANLDAVGRDPTGVTAAPMLSGGDNTSLIIGAVVGGVGLLIALVALIMVGVMCRRQKLVGDVNLRDVETMSVSQGNYGSTASLTTGGDAPREYGDLNLSPNQNQVSTYGNVNGGGGSASGSTSGASTGYVAVPPLGAQQYGSSRDVRHYSPMGMQQQ